MSKKKTNYNAKIPRHEVEALAVLLLPDIQKFFESEQGRLEYEEWEKQQNVEKE